MLLVGAYGELLPIAGMLVTENGRAQCPICGSQRVYRSRNRSWSERTQRVRGLRPYRCHKCAARFLDSVDLGSYGEPGEVMLMPPKKKERVM